MTDYKWKAIEPLSDKERKIDLAAMLPLYDTWKAAKSRLESGSSVNLKEFTQRRVRRLSVETGILERLYDLDRGTTEALVATGFMEDLVSRSSTDIEPSRLIDILQAQEAAIQLVMDCIAGGRALTRSVIHELHAILTQHQSHTTAIDQFGSRLDIPLLRGQFKQQPNNPRRPGGSIHEYCPPIHVNSEMENLLQWLEEYAEDDPIIVAAWFHHRFTQIHPYQDGNGRVAQALTTMILACAGLLPLVVDRDLRVEHIQALETADQGDLSLLAALFARLEREAILQALSVDADAEISLQRSVTSAVIDTLTDRFGRRRQVRAEEFRHVNEVSRSLRTIAFESLTDTFENLRSAISKIAVPEIRFTEGGPDHANAHWYKFEVVKSANAGGKFANFAEEHYFLKASIRAERERLVFVTSFHHVGRELSGVMEATAFAKLESFEDSDDRESAPQDFFVCSLDPFVYTYMTPIAEIKAPFLRWLDHALAVAIKEYGDRL